MIYDLDTKNKNEIKRKFDIAIIGCGTVGLITSVLLKKKGFSVVALESGSLKQNSNFNNLNRCIFKKNNYLSAHNGRYRCIGGTSTRWGCGLLPFSDGDLDENFWPIKNKNLKKYLSNIENIFGITKSAYSDNKIFDDPNFIARYAKIPKFKYRNVYNIFFKDINSDRGPEVWVNATVNNFKIKKNKLYEIDAVSKNKSKICINAKKFIFCAGAIEITKLLLIINKRNKNIITNKKNILGHFFSDHISLPIADIKNPNLDKISKYFSYDFTNGIRRMRIEMTEKSLLRNKLPPFFIHIPNFTKKDETYMSLRKILQSNQKKEFPKIKYFFQIIKNFNWVINFLIHRIFKKKLLFPKNINIKFHLVIEQMPNVSNKISLNNKVDIFKMNIPEITWAVSKLDKKNIQKVIHEFKKFCDASCNIEIGEINFRSVKKINKDLENFTGIHHPVGTTKISKTNNIGIVDKNLRLFNIKNSYILSTSVFPKGCGSNPTMTLLMFALRLIDKISKKN